MNESPERSAEIFRGHFDQCLSHFWDRLRVSIPRGSKGASDAKRPLADFCGAEVDTIARWMNGDIPTGDRRIKLMCLLDAIGYRIIEFERMPRAHRTFSELIGFGIVKWDEAAMLIGYSSTSHISQILKGEEGTSKEKDQKMWDIWKERKVQLEQKRKETQEVFTSSNSPLSPILRMEKLQSQPQPIVVRESEAKPAARSAVVSIAEGLLGLVSDGSFDELSEQDLALLQPSATTILQLSARLSALGSQLLTAKVKKGVPYADGK